MAKRPNSINVLNRFSDIYLSKFKTAPDPMKLLTCLINDDLADFERIRNYLIIEEYYRLLRENNGISYLTLIELSDKYKLNERQIQNIIYKWSEKYKRFSNVIEARLS